MLGFETLTLAPIDCALVEKKLLAREEKRLAQRLSRPGAEKLAPHLDAARARMVEEGHRCDLT